MEMVSRAAYCSVSTSTRHRNHSNRHQTTRNSPLLTMVIRKNTHNLGTKTLTRGEHHHSLPIILMPRPPPRIPHKRPLLPQLQCLPPHLGIPQNLIPRPFSLLPCPDSSPRIPATALLRPHFPALRVQMIRRTQDICFVIKVLRNRLPAMHSWYERWLRSVQQLPLIATEERVCFDVLSVIGKDRRC